MAKQDLKDKRDGSWEWSSKANNAKLLEAIAEFNSNTQKVSLIHNGILAQAKKQALELAENNPDKLGLANQLFKTIYNVDNPLLLPPTLLDLN